MEFSVTTNFSDIAKDLESKLTERPDALFSSRDVKGFIRRMKAKAITGETGFIFRTDYNKDYTRKNPKGPGNYLKATGKMLGAITFEEKISGLDRSYSVFIKPIRYKNSTKTTEDIAKYHNTGTAKGGKIRHFFDISDAEKKAIDKTINKRLEKLLK